MRHITSIASRIGKIENSNPGGEFAHLTNEQLEARISELDRQIGESLGLGRAATDSEIKEFCKKDGIEYPC